MKIAVITCNTVSFFWFRMDMMRHFVSLGHEVYAIGADDEADWADKFAENGVTYRQAFIQRNGTNPREDIKTLSSMKQLLKEIMPDKLFVVQAKAVIYGTLAANRLGITQVYPLIGGLGSLFLNNSPKTVAMRKVLVTEYKTALKKCPAVFFQNSDDRETFEKEKIIKNQKVVMLHGSGVNLDYYSMLPMPEEFAFLLTCRIIRDKGVIEYLEAARKTKKEYPNIKFMLVGPLDTNPSAIKMEELNEYIEDGTIEYFGNQEDVRPFLGKCNVFVLPSYREGTPKANLEAMSCGRAIITTDVTGCRETVVDGENGFLVPAQNADAIYEKMVYFINNKQQATAMGLRGRKMAEDIFDVNKVNATICETMGIN